VAIYLLKGNTLIEQLKQKFSGAPLDTHGFPYCFATVVNLNPLLIFGRDYTIKVASEESPTNYVFSTSHSFSIISGSQRFLHITSPSPNSSFIVNAGIGWRGSTFFQVEWSSAGLQIVENETQVLVSLYQRDVYLCSLLYQSPLTTLNSGSISARLDQTLASGEDYRVLVKDAHNNSFFNYSAYFRIVASGNPSINILAPSPTASPFFYAGSNMMVSWRSSGLSTNYFSIYLLEGSAVCQVFQQNVIGAPLDNRGYPFSFAIQIILNTTLKAGNNYKLLIKTSDETSRQRSVNGTSGKFSIIPFVPAGTTIVTFFPSFPAQGSASPNNPTDSYTKSSSDRARIIAAVCVTLIGTAILCGLFAYAKWKSRVKSPAQSIEFEENYSTVV